MAEKSSGRDSEKEAAIRTEADAIFASFAAAMDKDPGSSAVQSLVKDWQAHITMHYYTCTKEILKCLGQMYTADDRFRENLDRGRVYCRGDSYILSGALTTFGHAKRTESGKPVRLRASGYVLVYRSLEASHVYPIQHVYRTLSG